MKTREKPHHTETIVLGQVGSPLGKERQGYFQTLYFIPLIGLFRCTLFLLAIAW